MERAGISDGFVYAPKPAAAPAAPIRVSLPPHNKDSFSNGNETIMFNIPCGKRGQYLNTRMSYLKFDLEVSMKVPVGTNVPVLALDGGAHSLFQSLELYHGTNLLEQIREYNNLYNAMLDMQEVSDGIGVRSVSEGTARGPWGRGNIVSPVSIPENIGWSQYHRTKAFSPNFPEARTNAINGDFNGHPQVTNVKDTSETASSHSWKNVTTPVSPYGYGNDDRFAKLVKNEPDTSADPTLNTEAEYAGVRKFPAKVWWGDSIRSYETACATSELSGGEGIGAVVDRPVTFTFCIPIMSGVIGGSMGKYIPVGALNSDLRLEMLIAPFADAVKAIAQFSTADANAKIADLNFVPSAVYSTGSSPLNNTHVFNMKNIELQMEYIEVASDVQTAIESSTGGQYVMSFESFFNIQNSVPASSTTFTQLIGAKFSSVKTVMSTFRDAAAKNKQNLSWMSRVNPFSVTPNRPEYYGALQSQWHSKYENGSGWYYSIGATHYPSKPVNSDEESFYEGLKSQHLVAVQSVPGSISKSSWNISARRDGVTDTSAPSSSKWFEHPLQGGTFFTAQNFESQSHKSHLAETGVNTLAQNMFMHARFPNQSEVLASGFRMGTDDDFTFVPFDTNTAMTTAWQQSLQQLTVDHYVHYDGLLFVVNGIANTRY